jgi:hypothetical protein
VSDPGGHLKGLRTTHCRSGVENGQDPVPAISAHLLGTAAHHLIPTLRTDHDDVGFVPAECSVIPRGVPWHVTSRRWRRAPVDRRRESRAWRRWRAASISFNRFGEC